MNKLTIGIPTFNRSEQVYYNATSLKRCNIPNWCQIKVIDDCSDEYDIGYLANVYPTGTKVIRRKSKSLGADWAIYDLLLNICDEDSEFVMLLDSDFIVSKYFIDISMKMIHKTDGILSLFNTPTHNIFADEHDVVTKKTIGSAATLWKRELACEILQNVVVGDDWDWRFCKYLDNTGKKIYVTHDSLVQHLGYHNGQNSHNHLGDLGRGFLDLDAHSAYILIENIMFNQQTITKDLLNRIGELNDNILQLRRTFSRE